MTIVVKNIKRRTSLGDIRIYRYVYIQYRNNGRVITKYVGKLEEIVEFYLRNKDKLRKCGGRDSNPRRPSPPDLKWLKPSTQYQRFMISNHKLTTITIHDNLIELFKKWLKNKRKISNRTIKDYLSSLMKWPREITPEIALEYLDNKYCVCLLYTSPSPRDRA